MAIAIHFIVQMGIKALTIVQLVIAAVVLMEIGFFGSNIWNND